MPQSVLETGSIMLRVADPQACGSSMPAIGRDGLAAWITRVPSTAAPALFAAAQNLGVPPRTDAGALRTAPLPPAHSSRKTATGTAAKKAGRRRDATRSAASTARDAAAQASPMRQAW